MFSEKIIVSGQCEFWFLETWSNCKIELNGIHGKWLWCPTKSTFMSFTLLKWTFFNNFAVECFMVKTKFISHPQVAKK